MDKFCIILLSSFFAVIRAPDIENSRPLYYQPIPEETAVDLFLPLELNQVLPLVLLQDQSNDLQYPDKFDKVFINKGRIINGTQFATQNPRKQLFFCPRENAKKRCLVLQEFKQLEPLQCAKEVIPIIYTPTNSDEEQECGSSEGGISLTVHFKICRGEIDPPNVATVIGIYGICYDVNERKTLFTNHFIETPPLLYSKELTEERKLKHKMTIAKAYIPLNYQILKAAIEKEEYNLTQNQAQQKDNTDETHVYKIQKLVPTDDMVFAIQRKTTYQYLNVEFQHEKLIDIWDDINRHIRLHAKEIFLKGRMRTRVLTGVFELSSTPRNDGQKSNMWVKVIYSYPPEDVKVAMKPTNGLGILMNNYIDTAEDSGASSNPIKISLKNYCPQDLCVNSLQDKFKEIGGRVRCCAINYDIGKLFELSNHLIHDISLLPIPGIVDEIVE